VNSPIDPIQPFSGASPSGRSSAPLRGAGDFSAALASAERAAAPTAGSLPAVPPPELAAHIAAAARAWDSIAASGRHVSFDEVADGGVRIQLHDESGATATSVGPSALFDLIDQESGE
jgi:hypothetical protein